MDNILGSSRRCWQLRSGRFWSWLVGQSQSQTPGVSHDPTYPFDVESYLPASQ